MKRNLIIIICFLFGINTFAATDNSIFEKAVTLYNQQRYQEARVLFVEFKNANSEYSNKEIDKWIQACKTEIDKIVAQQKAAERKRLTAEEKRKAEEKLKRRKEQKLIYITSNAYIENKEYKGMHQAIKGYIANNSNFKFTDDPEMSYWSVYITSNATEYSKGMFYLANIESYIIIKNEIEIETIYEDEIINDPQEAKSTMGVDSAAKIGYKVINKEIADIIINQINKNIN